MEHVDSGDQEREQDFDQREELDDGEYTREREYDRADDRGQNNQHGDAGNNDQQGEVNPGTNLYVTRLSFEVFNFYLCCIYHAEISSEQFSLATRSKIE